MFRLLLSLSPLLLLSPLAAAEPTVVKLWPEKPPGEEKDIGPEKYMEGKPGQLEVKRLTNVSEPTVSVYRPANPNGTAVVVAPGGGYSILAIEHEGSDVCTWLNELGVTACLLKYRVPKRPGQTPDNLAALQDGQRAVSVVKARAAEWGVDPAKVGILGFSAGGNLAASVALFPKRLYVPVDAADMVDQKPAFAALIYPAYLNDKAALKPVYAEAVTKDSPPTFFVHASNDPISSEGSAYLYLALKKAGVPAEMHLYADGGHGFGMKKGPHPVATWPDRCADWLKGRGLIAAK